MRTRPLHPEIVMANAAAIRESWDAGDHDAAHGALQHADRDVLRWLMICASTGRGLRLAIQQEEMRRSFAREASSDLGR